jgi:hypothetical protein
VPRPAKVSKMYFREAGRSMQRRSLYLFLCFLCSDLRPSHRFYIYVLNCLFLSGKNLGRLSCGLKVEQDLCALVCSLRLSPPLLDLSSLLAARCSMALDSPRSLATARGACAMRCVALLQ